MFFEWKIALKSNASQLFFVEAKLQEDFDDANSQAYPRSTKKDFDFKKDLSSWIIQVTIKQSKIFK